MTIAAGSRLGPYEILAPLGVGGMGEVYRARDTRLKREVAIKLLPAALSTDLERLARFEQEAQAASALNHPAIVTVYDIGTSDGSTYIAVEIASGLAAAHEAGIVHRDVKPENLMITRDGRVKILDFGLAKLAPVPSVHASEMLTAAAATEPGVLLGTVSYMSPEQARGLPVDHRSDIFSLGAVLCGSSSPAANRSYGALRTRGCIRFRCPTAAA